MMNKRFQNNVASGRFTLPAAILFFVVVSCFVLYPGILSEDGRRMCVNALISVALTYDLQEMHNRFLLIRIRTYMVPAVYLFLSAAALCINPHRFDTPIALCGIMTMHLLCCTYQKRNPSGYVFYAFVLLGLASVEIGPLLYLAPILLLNLIIQLRGLNPRSFFAALLGLGLPYVVWLFYAYHTESWDIYDHFRELVVFEPLTWEPLRESLQNPDIYFYVPFSFFCLIAGWHTAAYSYDDKIKTRMLLKVLLINHFMLFLLILWQPQFLSPLLGLQIATGSVILTHYFALTSHWLSNFLFCLFLIYFIGLTIYEIWMPSFNFL